MFQHLEALEASIARRKAFPTDRKALHSAVKAQYARIGLDSKNLEILQQEDVYSITTAHQPTLLTGPLYFIYKICSAINLSRKLNEAVSGSQIVPVFIIGGEDHDLDEMDHMSFFGKNFKWETDQTGSVGRMSTEDLSPLLDEIREVLGQSPFADELRELFDTAFVPGRSYGDSMHRLVGELFAHTELIVAQMDDPALKSLFVNVLTDELENQTSSELINGVQQKVESMGYKPQAYVRDINIFYLKDNLRNRIELDNGHYRVVDSDISFTADQMANEVAHHPERFSPNVNLRPLYQETVLPNLAYIGGGGEIAYWLERKAQFEHYGVPFPILIRRNSVLHINNGMRKLREKVDVPLDGLFLDPEKEISNWVREHSDSEIDITGEAARVEEALAEIASKAGAISQSVERAIEAFKVKTMKEVDHLGKRLVREEKSRHETQIKQIRKLFDKLFPAGKLQERHDNFIPFYLSNGRAYLDMLINELDPLEEGFIVIEETDA